MVSQMSEQNSPIPQGPPPCAEAKKRKQTWWNVREAIASLHGLEAAKRYDEYLKEHRIRLKELGQIAGHSDGSRGTAGGLR